MLDTAGLRAAIEEKLADDLGIFTFPTGDTVPAVSVLIGNNNYPPPDTTISGLECAIVVDLGVSIKNLLDNCYQKTWRAAVVLKQWDSSDSAIDVIDYLPKLEEAIAETDLAIEPGSIRGLASERDLNNLQMLQLTVFQVEMTS
jgi:hypothetical protein